MQHPAIPPLEPRRAGSLPEHPEQAASLGASAPTPQLLSSPPQAVSKFEQALAIDANKHDALWCLGNALTSQARARPAAVAPPAPANSQAP